MYFNSCGDMTKCAILRCDLVTGENRAGGRMYRGRSGERGREGIAEAVYSSYLFFKKQLIFILRGQSHGQQLVYNNRKCTRSWTNLPIGNYVLTLSQTQCCLGRNIR